MALPSVAGAQEATPESIRVTLSNLDLAISELQKLSDSESVHFGSDADELKFVKAIQKLTLVRTSLQKLQAEASNGMATRKDQAVQQLYVIQKLISGYLGRKDTFAYHLKEGPVQVQIDASGAVDEVLKRLPFIHVGVKGQIEIDPGEELITQFNALKTELYQALLEVAQLDPSDRRVNAIAGWASQTKVVYPTKKAKSRSIFDDDDDIFSPRMPMDPFGEPLITSEQLSDLKLKSE